MAFLGHIVSSKDTRVNTQNIEAIQSWPRHTSPTDIRIFLGLDSYYRIFVEGFSSITYPLIALTQKKANLSGRKRVRKDF